MGARGDTSRISHFDTSSPHQLRRWLFFANIDDVSAACLTPPFPPQSPGRALGLPMFFPVARDHPGLVSATLWRHSSCNSEFPGEGLSLVQGAGGRPPKRRRCDNGVGTRSLSRERRARWLSSSPTAGPAMPGPPHPHRLPEGECLQGFAAGGHCGGCWGGAPGPPTLTLGYSSLQLLLSCTLCYRAVNIQKVPS